jgi:hypothetical protein
MSRITIDVGSSQRGGPRAAVAVARRGHGLDGSDVADVWRGAWSPPWSPVVSVAT